MNFNTTMIAIALAIALAAPAAAASARDEAAQQFLSTHQSARFVDDGADHRYYIIYDFAAAAGDDIVEGAREFALAHGGLLGLTADGVGLDLDRVVGYRGTSYVRFDQTIGGRPVFGAGVVATVDPDGEIVKLNSTAVASVQPLRGALMEPAVAADAALAMTPDAGAHGMPVLGYLPIEEQAIPVYLVSVTAPGPHLWLTYVDAVSGAVLLRRDAVLRHDAEIFEENPTSDYDTTLVTLENIVTEGEHAYHTYGDYIRVARCTNFSGGQCTAHQFQAEATDEEGFLEYEPSYTPGDLNDGFAEVQTYWSLDTFYTWLRDEFAFDPLFVDAETGLPGQSIWIYVNMNFANGFFMGASQYYGTPDLIALGQSDKDYSYDNDVSRHEFTHAMSSQIFDVWMVTLDSMGPDFSGQAIEEGTADYFPCSRHNSSRMGEFIGIARDLENEDTCPEHLWGEGHHDGQIMSGALWSVREEWGAKKVDHMQYRALAANSMSSFGQWAQAIKLEAYLMVSDEDPELQLTSAEYELLEDELYARNLEFCTRAVPIPDGDWKFQYMPYSITSGGTPSAVQYVVTTGDETEVLELEFEYFGDWYDVLVREGEPIFFSWSQSGYNYSWEAEYDFKWFGSGAPMESIEISNLTELQLQKNTDYYFSIICYPNNAGCQNKIWAHLSNEPAVPEEDAGPDGGDGDAGPGSVGEESGCDCRVGPGGQQASLIGTILSIL